MTYIMIDIHFPVCNWKVCVFQKSMHFQLFSILMDPFPLPYFQPLNYIARYIYGCRSLESQQRLAQWQVNDSYFVKLSRRLASYTAN